MRKSISLTLCLLTICTSLSAQVQLEAGINYLDGSFSIAGAGVYIQPGYALSSTADVALHLGFNSFIGDDQSRTKSRRTASGQIPIFRVSYIRRFPNTKGSEIPYLGVGAGTYFAVGDPQLFKSVKPGAALSAGVIFGRSNLGLAFNLVPDASFIQIGYGFTILKRNG